MLKTLANGLIEGTIEVRSFNEPFPQSFLLVDDERVYLFFLSAYRNTQNEANRAESRSLRQFNCHFWLKFWQESTPLDLTEVIQTSLQETES